MTKEIKDYKIFPHDYETLWFIKELEICFGLSHKDTCRMSKAELIKYIDQIAIVFLK